MKTENQDPGAFLCHMYEAGLILKELSSIPFEEFQKNRVHVFAAERAFEILGEATKNLQNLGFADRYPEMPWREMKSVRNIMAHVYYKVEPRLLREMSLNDVPKAMEQMEDIPEFQEAWAKIKGVEAAKLTGTCDVQKQERILRLQIKTLIRNGVIKSMPHENLTIPGMVILVQSVPEKDRMQAIYEVNEIINRLEHNTHTPERDIGRDL